MIEFVAGYAYGITSVIIGQPLDTIKTRIQASTKLTSSPGIYSTAKEIFQSEGIKGLYRGGLPMIFGSGLIRSIQFGVNAKALSLISQYQLIDSDTKWFGFLRPNVIAAGLVGGFFRGIVEGPIEFMKVRRQVIQNWKMNEFLQGTGTTTFRNTFLFALFVVYIDISKQLVPGGLGSFGTGAICANLAWFSIWPLDVLKSQIQSGQFKDRSVLQLAWQLFRSGQMYRGLVPGLTRSGIANGFSMMAYDKTMVLLKDYR